MTDNVSVKALFSWVNSIQLSQQELHVNDFQDGTVLLKVVHLLKQEPIPFTNSIEDCFRLVAHFLETECRFNATKGTSLSWNNIKDGVNLTVEVAKVLLLLVYHDVMNDRRTLNRLDCDVEREIAKLTGSFVMENEGYVYLASGLVDYLESEESPVIHHKGKQKIMFVEMETVASSSTNTSPLQNIMNTPKFQLRKLQRQISKERDYTEGLESELSAKSADIAQKERHINQLQWCLDKLKKEQTDGEHAVREQITELENKNDMLRKRLNEILKENKEFSSMFSHTEHKMNALTEENGVLSLQMRTVYPKLAILEAEIGRLKENYACAEKGWKEKTSSLESKLDEVTTQKESLTEQIEILQGKISHLQDELSAASKEEVGENMGHIMEREIFETERKTLKNKLERALCSLNEAELCIQAKTQQLAECQKETTHQKDLLSQQNDQTKRLMQEKDERLDKLQQEITGQRVVLQREIEDLKFQLQQAQQEKCEQISRLQQQIIVQQQEAEKLRQTVKEKEDLISLTEENMKDLNTKYSALSYTLINKDKQINSLGEEMEILKEESKQNQNKLQERDKMLATLTVEKCNEQQLLKNQIELFTIQLEKLTMSLKQAEQETQNKQDLLVETQKLNVQQQELLQQDIAAREKSVQTLNEEMHVKNEQLAILKNDCACQVESLEKEITVLKGQLEHLNSDLRKAEEQLQNEKLKLVKHEKESTDQIQLLQQRLAASEDEIRATKEMFKEEDEITTLKMQNLENSQKFNDEIENLQNEIQCLRSSLRNAEENVQTKENLFAEQTLQASRDMEVLRVQMVTSRQEAEVLNAKICEKEKQILLLKTENASYSKLVQQEIETLNEQMQAISNSLDLTQKELQTKKEMVIKLEQESIFQKELLQQQLLATEEEVERLKKDNQTKEKQMMHLSTASSTQLDLLHQTKGQEILQIRKDNAEQVYLLQQQLASANAEKQAAQALQLATHKEKEVLMARMGQAEKDRRSLEKQLEALFIQAKQSTERKLEAEERYKAQVEMTVNHDNIKKQMERQLKRAITENKTLQLDLDKAQTNEKKLNSMVASLEEQLAFADQKLRAQNETVGNGESSQSLNSGGPSTSLGAHSTVHKKRAINSDSLEQSSLEDPLNNTRYLCTPDEFSTPCGCSTEQLAERRGFCAESPETFYLKPTVSRNGKENKMEFVSGLKTPASSVKRRRTTQVISITMDKKTAGSCEDEDTFGSLASAASHPNLSSAAFVRPVPMETFDTPAKKMPPTGDQLIGLPGYRRSAVYPNATSTFCVGAENEPDGASEDWMRIAELQARNKACLPHLKSSYPVEFDTGSSSAFIFTDEELRTGDPSDTIRRASMMPGQLKDSVTSHRLSLMMANSATTANTHSQCLSLMPGPLPLKTTSLTQLRSSKDTMRSSSMASVLQTSPEKKMKASCFPRPLTPKNKNMLTGPSDYILHPTLSPAERRQSMVFTIDNTPKNKSYLKRGLNKLRRSTRKSPCKGFKSPAQMVKNRGQEKMPAMNIHTAVGRAGRSGKSPLLATKSQKNFRSSDYKQDSKVANAEG